MSSAFAVVRSFLPRVDGNEDEAAEAAYRWILTFYLSKACTTDSILGLYGTMEAASLLYIDS